MGTMQFFDWVNRHARLVVVVVVVAALGLGALAPIVADTNDSNFDPAGEVFDQVDLSPVFRCNGGSRVELVANEHFDARPQTRNGLPLKGLVDQGAQAAMIRFIFGEHVLRHLLKDTRQQQLQKQEVRLTCILRVAAEQLVVLENLIHSVIRCHEPGLADDRQPGGNKTSLVTEPPE